MNCDDAPPTTREYDALLRGAAFVDLPSERLVRFTGADRVTFLESQLTQKLADLAPREVRPAALADRKGHAVADLVVARDDDALLVCVRSDRVDPVLSLLDRHRFSEDVAWSVAPFERALLLAGPLTEALLASLRLTTRRELQRPVGAPVLVAMPIAEISPHDWLLFMAPESEVEVRAILSMAGGLEVGARAFHLRRMEVGVGWFGHELDEERLIPEGGWSDRVHYAKGCYLGQETLARLHYRGQLNWLLSRVGGSGQAPAVSTRLLDAGAADVGWLASAEVRPEGGWSGLAYLRRAFRESPGPLVQAGAAEVRGAGVEWRGEVRPFTPTVFAK